MTTDDSGWSWFDDDDHRAEAGREEQALSDVELVRVFGRCFRGNDGVRALEHLCSLTLDRALGPDSSDALLRHIEGQRQLVAHILSLVERADRWPLPDDSGAAGRTNRERSKG